MAKEVSQTDQKTLLVLGARLAQIPAIRAGLDKGLRVVAIDPDPSAPGLSMADVAYSYDLADADTILALARRHAVDGIMTLAADYPMPTVACVAAELGLPGPSPAVVANATNKRLMRAALHAAGVVCPSFVHVLALDEAVQAVATLGGDVIFKPAMSHGGRGITRLTADAEIGDIEFAFNRALSETRADGVMVEAFVEGPEFSVETLTHEGGTEVVAVTDKLTSGAPYYVEVGHNQPSRWPPSEVAAIADTARQVVAALRMSETAGHVEIRLSADGPVVMEVAARLGGGFINSHLVPISTGVDLVGAAIQVAIGDTPDLEPREPSRSAAIRFLRAEPGVVTQIDGVDHAQHAEGVEEIAVYVEPGDRIDELVNASGRPGHVITSASNPELAAALADDASSSVRIQTEASLP